VSLQQPKGKNYPFWGPLGALPKGEMTMTKIKILNNQDGTWTVFNTKNGQTAKIVRINEYNLLSFQRKLYRVDYHGQTIASMLDHFQTAKKVAVDKVRIVV